MVILSQGNKQVIELNGPGQRRKERPCVPVGFWGEVGRAARAVNHYEVIMVEVIQKMVYKMFVNHSSGLRIKDAINDLSTKGVASYEIVTAVQNAFLNLYRSGAISMPDLPSDEQGAAFHDWVVSSIVEPEQSATIHGLKFAMPSKTRSEYPTMVANA